MKLLEDFKFTSWPGETYRLSKQKWKAVQHKKVLMVTIVSLIAIVASALVYYLIIPPIVDLVVIRLRVLREGSAALRRWERQQLPLITNMYLWNLTNAAEVVRGVSSPRFQEVGPYAFEQITVKTPIEFKEDSIVYSESTTYQHRPDLTAPRSLDDTVITLHAALYGTAVRINTMLPLMMYMMDDAVASLFPGATSVFAEVRVGDLLFDGLLLNCSSSASTLATLVCGTLPLAAPPSLRKIPDSPYYAYSLFHHKNGTKEGPHEEKRGYKNIRQVAEMIKYQNQSELSVWQPGSKCNQLRGTDTLNFAPFISKDDQIEIFISDICQVLTMYYEDEETLQGFDVYKFSLRKWLDSKDNNPDFGCYCMKGKEQYCSKNGVRDISRCMKAPLVISNPHFLDADAEFRDYAQGSSPDPEKHLSVLYIEPQTGIPVKAAKRVQFNMPLTRMKGFGFVENITEGLFPLLWIDETILVDWGSLWPLMVLFFVEWLVNFICICVGTLMIKVFVCSLLTYLYLSRACCFSRDVSDWIIKLFYDPPQESSTELGTSTSSRRSSTENDQNLMDSQRLSIENAQSSSNSVSLLIENVQTSTSSRRPSTENDQILTNSQGSSIENAQTSSNFVSLSIENVQTSTSSWKPSTENNQILTNSRGLSTENDKNSANSVSSSIENVQTSTSSRRPSSENDQILRNSQRSSIENAQTSTSYLGSTTESNQILTDSEGSSIENVQNSSNSAVLSTESTQTSTRSRRPSTENDQTLTISQGSSSENVHTSISFRRISTENDQNLTNVQRSPTEIAPTSTSSQSSPNENAQTSSFQRSNINSHHHPSVLASAENICSVAQTPDLVKPLEKKSQCPSPVHPDILTSAENSCSLAQTSVPVKPLEKNSQCPSPVEPVIVTSAENICSFSQNPGQVNTLEENSQRFSPLNPIAMAFTDNSCSVAQTAVPVKPLEKNSQHSNSVNPVTMSSADNSCSVAQTAVPVKPLEKNSQHSNSVNPVTVSSADNSCSVAQSAVPVKPLEKNSQHSNSVNPVTMSSDDNSCSVAQTAVPVKPLEKNSQHSNSVNPVTMSSADNSCSVAQTAVPVKPLEKNSQHSNSVNPVTMSSADNSCSVAQTPGPVKPLEKNSHRSSPVNLVTLASLQSDRNMENLEENPLSSRTLLPTSPVSSQAVPGPLSYSEVVKSTPVSAVKKQRKVSRINRYKSF